MVTARCSMIIAAAALTGCASPDPQAGQRTVFNNPYAVPALDRTGIGPRCDEELGRDATCLGAPIIQARRGRFVLLANGETERLTRNQARILRERAELLESLRDQAAPPPSPVVPSSEPPQDETP